MVACIQFTKYLFEYNILTSLQKCLPITKEKREHSTQWDPP